MYIFYDKYIKVVEPDSKKKLIWDFFILFFLLLNVLYIPLDLSFNIEFNDSSKIEIVAQLIFEKLPISVFLCDILITFNTAFYSKGILVYDKFKIIKNYFENYFLLDLVTLGPFFLVLVYSSYSGFFKVMFLLRVIKLRNFVKKMEESIQFSDKNYHIFELLKLLFMILYIAHLCGCGWHYISQWQIAEGKNDSWLNLHSIADKNWKIRYINSVYFAVLTMITVGIINTNNYIEQAISILIVLILSGVFAYSINTIGQILQEMNINENELKYLD